MEKILATYIALGNSEGRDSKKKFFPISKFCLKHILEQGEERVYPFSPFPFFLLPSPLLSFLLFLIFFYLPNCIPPLLNSLLSVLSPPLSPLLSVPTTSSHILTPQNYSSSYLLVQYTSAVCAKKLTARYTVFMEKNFLKMPSTNLNVYFQDLMCPKALRCYQCSSLH